MIQHWTVVLCTLLSQNMRRSTISVVGGGISGACAAAELSKYFRVVLYDQGKRGPGGRASHRSVKDGCVQPDDEIDEKSLQFDHGCQFFRADTPEMRKELLATWVAKGWAASWDARIGTLGSKSNEGAIDFFGLPSREESVYIGVGGMHLLPRRILEDANVQVETGTRVSSVKADEMGKWNLYGVSGKAAYHDTTESQAAILLGSSDAVVFTDISSCSGAWHRASAGIPDTLRLKIPDKIRMPLFSCMVALEKPLGLPLDAFTAADDVLWFAARSQSKPGFPRGAAECWTLVSTPMYALDQIREITMRDPATGAFRPQENSYLNAVPGPALFEAFCRVVEPSNVPNPVYLQAQRWGSGLPAPDHLFAVNEDICGTRYAGSLPASLVYPKISTALDFVADDNLHLYYAGDFVSHRNPGFEAAALSGLDLAKHLVNTLD